MESLRKEIQDEMKRTRLDKGRLYDLLLKIVDGGVGGGEGVQGPAGPAGPRGPAGPVGSSGECKCTKEEVPAPTPVVEKPKVSTATKKTTTKKSTTTKKTTV